MKKQKLFQQILMKKADCKTQNFYILLTFLLITVAYSEICYYLLLSDKISSKTKIFITISSHKQRTKRSFILINVL